MRDSDTGITAVADENGVYRFGITTKTKLPLIRHWINFVLKKRA